MTTTLPRLLGVLLLAAVAQLSALGQPQPFPWHLSWLLVVALCWGMLYGRWSGILCGLLAGALQDLLTGPSQGQWLSYALVAYAAGHTSLVLLRHSYVMLAAAAILATALCELVQAALLVLQHHAWAWPDFLSFIVPLAMANALLALPVFALLQRLAPRLRLAEGR